MLNQDLIFRALPFRSPPFIGLLQLNADVPSVPREALPWDALVRRTLHASCLMFASAPAASFDQWLMKYLLSFVEWMKAMCLG